MDSKKKDLVSDNKGAIMVMGLFMSISLIGSLWFIMGIGNALVIRNTAMEAADHAVFSAATVHARGMNYISALNLIMFALTVVYVLIAVVADALIFAGGVGFWAKVFLSGPCLCPAIPPVAAYCAGTAAIAKPACEFGHKIADFGAKYASGIKSIFTALGKLETVVQVGFPAVAEVSSLTIGQNYKAEDKQLTSVLLAPSLVPMKKFNMSDQVIGLPVESKKNDYLCDRSFNKVKDLVSGVVPGFLAGAIGAAIDVAKGYVGWLPTERSGFKALLGIGCDGAPFDQKDIHLVNENKGVKNGADHFQMWSLVMDAKDTERSKGYGYVSMSKNKGKSEAANMPATRIYYAQAEYYYDCEQAWGHEDCYNAEEKMASFSMNWRARLRRVHAPRFGSGFIQQAAGFLMAGGSVPNFVAGVVGSSPAGQKIAGMLGKFTNGSLSNILTKTDAGNGINDLNNFFTGGDRPIH